jgi:chaperonin GroEL
MKNIELKAILENFTEKELNLAYKDELLEGVNYLADSVKVTLGARGKNVLFNSRIGKPQITKDGVTVAREIHSDNPYQNMAIQIVREAAENTVKTSGDGTTTTIVLSQYLINKGFELLQNGYRFYELSREMDIARDEIIEDIKKSSYSIENHFTKLRNVATVSSNSAEIGDFIYDIMKDIGIHGAIEVKESGKTTDKIEKVMGIKVNKGFYAPHFVNDHKKMKWSVPNGYIVLFDDVVRTWNDIAPYVQRAQGSPVLFMVNEVEPTILQTLINNKMQNPNFNIMITEHDGFGDRKIEIMNDIAALTGATVASAEQEGDMGFAAEIVVTEDSTSILDGSANEEIVKNLIEDTKYKLSDDCEIELDDNEIKYYKRRMATLAGGVAIIHVGGATQVEMKERKDRIDDAVEAVKAAIDRGISIGGGYTLINCSKKYLGAPQLNTAEGKRLVYNSIREPFNQLCVNAGFSSENRIQGVIDGKGYNVITDTFEDIINYEIYDPTGVLIDSLTNAIAVAKSILSIECSIYNG